LTGPIKVKADSLFAVCIFLFFFPAIFSFSLNQSLRIFSSAVKMKMDSLETGLEDQKMKYNKLLLQVCYLTIVVSIQIFTAYENRIGDSKYR